MNRRNTRVAVMLSPPPQITQHLARLCRDELLTTHGCLMGCFRWARSLESTPRLHHTLLQAIIIPSPSGGSVPESEEMSRGILKSSDAHQKGSDYDSGPSYSEFTIWDQHGLNCFFIFPSFVVRVSTIGLVAGGRFQRVKCTDYQYWLIGEK